MNIQEEVLAILCESNPRIKDNVDADLLKEGYIDSFEIVNIVMALEDTFEIEIDPELIVPENFQTLSCITQLIEQITSN